MSGSSYTNSLTGYRIAPLFQRDTIERVALRELNDAGQWTVLVNLNGLVWPYLTDDPSQVEPGVMLTTGTIKVPATNPASATPVTDDTIFGTDFLLQNGQLQSAGGDLAVVSGIANLCAAIGRRISVRLKELPYFPAYGCLVKTLLGKDGTPANNALAVAYVARAIAGDPRIARVNKNKTTATLSGDHIIVVPNATTVSGKTLPTGQISVS